MALVMATRDHPREGHRRTGTGCVHGPTRTGRSVPHVVGVPWMSPVVLLMLIARREPDGPVGELLAGGGVGGPDLEAGGGGEVGALGAGTVTDTGSAAARPQRAAGSTAALGVPSPVAMS